MGNGWWSHTFPKGIAFANVIFNNGELENTIKTYDITNIVTSTCFKLVGSTVITTTDCGLDLEMCHADAFERIQCGRDKITEDGCISLNCCYSELAGAPSCFYGVGSDFNNQYGTCVIEHELRSRCGEKDITEEECGDLGCCWDLSEDKNYPSCFYHGALVPTCSVDIFQRNSCGYSGISESECVDKYGCCYDQNSLTEDTRCYFQDIIPSGELSEPDCSDKKYRVKNLKKSSSGITATLDFGSQKCEKYDADITSLDFAATFETDTRLHLKVTPTDLEKYPHNADIPKEAFPFVPEVTGASDPEYVFDLEEDGDFNIVVKRKNGKLFSTLLNLFSNNNTYRLLPLFLLMLISMVWVKLFLNLREMLTLPNKLYLLLILVVQRILTSMVIIHSTWKLLKMVLPTISSLRMRMAKISFLNLVNCLSR